MACVCIGCLTTAANNDIQMMELDDKEGVLTYINAMLAPKAPAKQMYGEVFTPLSLVKSMLDRLPDSVWADSSLKWFDPSTGIGNFMVCVYYRLMEGLEDEFPSHGERKRHILQNMLYMAELNTKNVHLARKIFGEEANIYCGDSLQLDTQVEFGVEAFDIVLTNPPYNKGGIRSNTGKKLVAGTKSETIWPQFVRYGFDHLVPGGYLLYVTPLGWLKSTHSMHSEILSRRVEWVELWDNSKSKSVMYADIPLSQYLVKNVASGAKPTKVVCTLRRRKIENIESEIVLEKGCSVPLAYHSILRKLKNYMEREKRAPISSVIKTKTVKSTGTRMTLPDDSYTVEDKYAVDTYTIKGGLQVKRASGEHPDASKPKLILANKSRLRGMIVDDGRLSICGSDNFYILAEHQDPNALKQYLEFNVFRLVVNCTKYRQDFLDKAAFEYIPMLSESESKNKENDDEMTFYETVGFTPEEISTILS